ncbi:uroporphyrinogen-III synthase [Caldithrix abyssi]
MKLKNKTIVVTRQPEQARTLTQLIEKEGGKAVLFPTIATVAAEENIAGQERVIARLEQFDWLIFTSENAVKFFLKRLQDGAIQLPAIKIAAVGSRTAETLEKEGIPIHLIPDDFSAKGLIDAFATSELRGTRILIPSSNLAREELQTGLKLHGAQVETVIFYKTVPNPHFDHKAFRFLLLNKQIDVITFFSPSAFNFLVEILCLEGLNLLQTSETRLAAIGQTTARAINMQGLKVHIIPKISTSKGMVEAIINYYEGKEDERK